MSYPENLQLDAIAWFIREDETNAGGDWEQSNQYWLTGRRLCLQEFSCWDEIVQRSERHKTRIEAATGMDQDFESEFMKKDGRSPIET